MPTHTFNLKRFEQLEELLDIEYDKLHEFRKEISLSTGNEKILLKQRLKREIIPNLRELEKEYAGLLAAGVSVEAIPEAEAQVLVAEVVEAVAEIEQNKQADTPQQMLQLLTQIRDQLGKQDKSASAKLKVSLPIIPLISSYEMEMDTEGVLTAVWNKTRDLFKRLVPRRPK